MFYRLMRSHPLNIIATSHTFITLAYYLISHLPLCLNPSPPSLPHPQPTITILFPYLQNTGQVFQINDLIHSTLKLPLTHHQIPAHYLYLPLPSLPNPTPPHHHPLCSYLQGTGQVFQINDHMHSDVKATSSKSFIRFLSTGSYLPLP